MLAVYCTLVYILLYLIDSLHFHPSFWVAFYVSLVYLLCISWNLSLLVYLSAVGCVFHGIVLYFTFTIGVCMSWHVLCIDHPCVLSLYIVVSTIVLWCCCWDCSVTYTHLRFCLRLYHVWHWTVSRHCTGIDHYHSFNNNSLHKYFIEWKSEMSQGYCMRSFRLYAPLISIE